MRIFSNNYRTAFLPLRGTFGSACALQGYLTCAGAEDGPALSAMPGIDDVQEVKGSDARCTEQTPRSRGGHRTALGALGHGTRRPGVAAERGGGVVLAERSEHGPVVLGVRGE